MVEEGSGGKLLNKDNSMSLEDQETIKRVAGIAVARFQAEFPNLTDVYDISSTSQSLVLVGKPPKGRKTAPATNLKCRTNSLGASTGSANPEKPEKFKLEWWVGSWGFSKGDLTSADKAAQRAVTHALVSEKQVILDEKRIHRTRNSDFQSLMNKLGYKEEGEMGYLADMVIYDLLKDNDFSAHLTEYQRLAENLVNQKTTDVREKTRAGFLIAKARIYHLAQEPLISKSLIGNARSIAQEWSYGDLSRLLDDLIQERTIFWDRYKL